MVNLSKFYEYKNKLKLYFTANAEIRDNFDIIQVKDFPEIDKFLSNKGLTFSDFPIYLSHSVIFNDSNLIYGCIVHPAVIYRDLSILDANGDHIPIEIVANEKPIVVINGLQDKQHILSTILHELVHLGNDDCCGKREKTSRQWEKTFLMEELGFNDWNADMELSERYRLPIEELY